MWTTPNGILTSIHRYLQFLRGIERDSCRPVISNEVTGILLMLHILNVCLSVSLYRCVRSNMALQQCPMRVYVKYKWKKKKLTFGNWETRWVKALVFQSLAHTMWRFEASLWQEMKFIYSAVTIWSFRKRQMCGSLPVNASDWFIHCCPFTSRPRPVPL